VKQGYIDSLTRLGLNPAEFTVVDEPPPPDWGFLADFLYWLVRPGENDMFLRCYGFGPNYVLRAAWRRTRR
jgi:hypothetical protein